MTDVDWRGIVMDLHAALGVPWGDNPYLAIERLREGVEAYRVEQDTDGEWHILDCRDGRQIWIFSQCPRLVIDPDPH